MTTVVRCERVHARQQRVAAEYLRELRRAHIGLADPQHRRHLARMGQQSRGRDRRRRHARPRGALHLADTRSRAGVARQLAKAQVAESKFHGPLRRKSSSRMVRGSPRTAVDVTHCMRALPPLAMLRAASRIPTMHTCRTAARTSLLSLLLAMTTGAATAADAPAGSWTLVHAGALLDRPGHAPRGPSTLLVRDGRVAAVRDGHLDASAFEGAPPETTVVDLRDRFVLPGLIDSHVHLTSDKAGVEG